MLVLVIHFSTFLVKYIHHDLPNRYFYKEAFTLPVRCSHPHRQSTIRENTGNPLRHFSETWDSRTRTEKYKTDESKKANCLKNNGVMTKVHRNQL